MNPIVQRLTEIERIGRNTAHIGDLEEFTEGTAKVRITLINDQSIITPSLPLVGRTSATVGEPVLLITPRADFTEGYVFCFSPDPAIAELASRVQQLEQAS